MFFGRNDAKAETPVLWLPHEKSWLIGKDWCWEGLEAGGKGNNRGWDGWMPSPTRWMWVCVNSGRWWWTGRPGVLRFMGSQRVGHNWATELNWKKKNLDWWLFSSLRYSADSSVDLFLLSRLVFTVLLGTNDLVSFITSRKYWDSFFPLPICLFYNFLYSPSRTYYLGFLIIAAMSSKAF